MLNFHNEMTGLVNKGRVVNIVCLDFRKAFDTISHEILIYKMLLYGLDKETERQVINCLNGQAQRVVISDRKCHWGPFNISVPLGSILGQIFFKILSYLYEGAECTFSNSEDDTKMGGLDDMPEGSAAIQRNLNRLEKWANMNLINFDKKKHKILNPRWSNFLPPSWNSAF